MNFDNIIEKRIVDNGQHNLVLEISKDELNKSYNEINNKVAEKIVGQHLINRGDDGRATDVEIRNQEDNQIVKIQAKVNYLGNQHTDPKIY